MTEPAASVPARPAEKTGAFGALVVKLRRAGVALQSPILVREMRTLLRGRKFFASHMLLLVILAGVLLIAATMSAAAGAKDPSRIGIALYFAFFVGLGVVVIFLVPAFSCTGLTTERESKTLDLLLTTTIRPWEVVWGKLLSSLVVIMLFMASALPLVTICFLFGGVSPWDLALLYLAVLFCTLVVSSMSLAVSAHCKESKSAVVISYVLTMIFVGVLIAAVIFLLVEAGSGRNLSTFAALLSSFHWTTQLLIVTIPQFLGVSIFALNFAAAANRLKPSTANRSTNLRVIWLLFLLGSVMFYMLAVWVAISRGRIGKGDWDELLLATLCVAAPLFWLGILYFASEEVRLSPRLMEDIAAQRGLRAPLRVFMPGPGTALACSAVLVLLIFGGLIGFGWAAALGAGDDVSAWRHVSAAGPMALFLLVSAAVAALFSSFGLKHRQAGFAAFGVCVFLAFGPMIHLGCQEAISSTGAPVRSTLWSLHYLSPIIAAASAWSGGAGPSPWDVISLPGGGPAAAALTVPLWEVSVLALGGLAAIIWTVAIIRIRRAQLRWRQEIAGASVTAPDAGRPADPGGAPAGGA